MLLSSVRITAALSGRLMAACAIVIACSASLAQSPPTLLFKSAITSADLPAGVEKRISPGASKAEVATLLGAQPALVLDGATLVITSPARGANRSMALSRLELRNGAKIITRGIDLEIVALSIVSESGLITAFDGEERRISGVAAKGSNGASGQSAGTVVIDGELNANDVLRVNLAGQSGQTGGSGSDGPAGAPGPRGANGSDRLFDCARGGGNGGAGSQGGKGGRGGAGGEGGDGGRLILRGGIAGKRAQIDFAGQPGDGGSGGSQGVGGPGGQGGQGGSGTTWCRGGGPGPQGAQGEFGEPGEKGKDGRPGAVTAD